MNTKSLVLFVIIFALIVRPASSLAGTPSPQEQPSTAVRISPAQIENMQPGDSFSVNVSIEESPHLKISDIYAFQVDIHFDPTVLRVANIQPASISEFPIIAEDECNLFDEMSNFTYNGPTYGQIYYVASRSDVANSSFVNSGVFLFTVTFTVVSYGSSYMQLIQYPGHGSGDGTYFMTSEPSPTTGYVEIIPQLDSAIYGNLPSTPSAPSPPNNGTPVLASELLPFLIPFAFAIVLLSVIRRKIKSKKQPETLPLFLSPIKND